MDNSIKTAKYNVATFLPIFLFEMFSRAAYLYFLLQVSPQAGQRRARSAVPRCRQHLARWSHSRWCMQACLSWWSIVSPFGGFGSTAAIVFVLLVAAVKALWEDSKRHQEDRRTNASTAHVLQPDGASTCCCTALQLHVVLQEAGWGFRRLPVIALQPQLAGQRQAARSALLERTAHVPSAQHPGVPSTSSAGSPATG